MLKICTNLTSSKKVSSCTRSDGGGTAKAYEYLGYEYNENEQEIQMLSGENLDMDYSDHHSDLDLKDLRLEWQVLVRNFI